MAEIAPRSATETTMLYLDNAATTPVRPEVLQAMWPYLTGDFGNPSSHHTLGERAAEALAEARSSVAGVLGVRASDVVFTSGGTEGANLAIKGIALGNPRGRHIVSSAAEHEAVLESLDYLHRLHGFDITLVELDPEGRVTPDALARSIRPDTTLATFMYANNEIGSVNDIAALSATAHAHGIPFHTDAVQAIGWLSPRVPDLGVDALTLSGHKIGAPKGIGAAYIRGRLPMEALIHGGGQERARRSGTENVAFAVGLALALRLSEAEREAAAARVAVLRDEFVVRVGAELPHAFLTGHATERLPNHASFCFPGTSGEAVLLELERRGIISSSGSACAAGSDEPSHVLTAIGIEASVAQTAVRFSLPATVSPDELARTAEAVVDAVSAVAAP